MAKKAKSETADEAEARSGRSGPRQAGRAERITPDEPMRPFERPWELDLPKETRDFREAFLNETWLWSQHYTKADAERARRKRVVREILLKQFAEEWLKTPQAGQASLMEAYLELSNQVSREMNDALEQLPPVKDLAAEEEAAAAELDAAVVAAFLRRFAELRKKRDTRSVPSPDKQREEIFTSEDATLPAATARDLGPPFSLGPALREIRELLGLTQAAAAAKLGVAADTWRLVENGHRNLSNPTFYELPKALGVPMSWILLLSIGDLSGREDRVSKHVTRAQQAVRAELRKAGPEVPA